MEITFATNRKLSFAQGTITRPNDFLTMPKMWDTCNSMIIAWIQNSISDSIGKSILLFDSAQEIWL